MVAFVRGERLFASDAYGRCRAAEQSYARRTEYLGRSETHPSIETLRTKSYPDDDAVQREPRRLGHRRAQVHDEDYGGGCTSGSPRSSSPWC